MVSIPPLLFALLMWFIGTGAIVWLDSRPRATFKTSLVIAGLVSIAAMLVVWIKADDASASGAYIGFAAAIIVWGWHEMSFLMGFVAGPNRLPCPPDANGWRRFSLATATVIHHELAIAVTAILLFALTWGEPNQAAPLTFLLLFVLRLSAKFNLYFGVPNLSDEVFPTHLAYLKSYFRTARFNALLPFSIALGAGIVWWGWTTAHSGSASAGDAAIAMLIAGMAALGVVEHLFLVLPLRDGKMWRWASATNKAAKTVNID